MKIIQIQSHVYETKSQTFQHIQQFDIDSDTDIICLPEMFDCPYDNSQFASYAESFEGESYHFLQQLAIKHHAYVIGGSFPERDENNHIYNTAVAFDRNGDCIAKHRKVHLFDIDVKNGQSFKESDSLTPGNEITVFGTEFGKVGLCICFDIRFLEIMRLMALEGAKMVFVPAAFNQTTGPAHWQLSFQSLAMYNQIYMIGTAPALDPQASYHSWGHSIVTNPWGQVVCQMKDEIGLQKCEIDLEYIEQVRQQLPILKNRRTDLYTIQRNKKHETK